MLWVGQGAHEIPRRTRREIARDLDLADLVHDVDRFRALLGRLWVLDDDPFGWPTGSATSLSASIEQHVFRNPGDWSTEDLFEQLGAFDASDTRFAQSVAGRHSGPSSSVSLPGVRVAAGQGFSRAGPRQAGALLKAVRGQGCRGEHMEAFFGCLYYAALRPSEAVALRESDCVLPSRGWGRIDLASSEPRAGTEWTDDGTSRETRGLKHRAVNETAASPSPPSSSGCSAPTSSGMAPALAGACSALHAAGR